MLSLLITVLNTILGGSLLAEDDLRFDGEVLTAELNNRPLNLNSSNLIELEKSDPYFNDRFFKVTGVRLWEYLNVFHPTKSVTRADIESLISLAKLEEFQEAIEYVNQSISCQETPFTLNEATPEYPSGLTPSAVGLGAFPINSGWLSTGPNRPCPHSGIDIGSGGNPEPFTAGIYR